MVWTIVKVVETRQLLKRRCEGPGQNIPRTLQIVLASKKVIIILGGQIDRRCSTCDRSQTPFAVITWRMAASRG